MTWFVCCCCSRKPEDDNSYDVTDARNLNNNDLTKDNTIRSSAIQELKSKLGSKVVEDSSDVMIPEAQREVPHPPPPPHLSGDGLIMPRKPHNPVLDNVERQNLHKELLFNQKIGKNVLNQKSELQRALERHKDNIAKKEMESTIAAKTPELKKVIAERAKRLEDNTVPSQNEDDKVLSNEFLQARAKLRARTDSK